MPPATRRAPSRDEETRPDAPCETSGSHQQLTRAGPRPTNALPDRHRAWGEWTALCASHYPPELPVSQRRDDIAAAIRDHQVVIVAGETGSGKTTQLPKICLELGRGERRRLIGHTQPRRIAARSVAERIAEELGTELGRPGRLPGPVHRPDVEAPAGSS